MTRFERSVLNALAFVALAMPAIVFGMLATFLLIAKFEGCVADDLFCANTAEIAASWAIAVGGTAFFAWITRRLWRPNE